MEIKCGTDIIEISRIRESIENLGEKFINKIYTKAEIDYCESKKTQKYQHYAARFAAKEAAFKAISWKLKNKYEISWKDIEVIADEQGRPLLSINGINTNDIVNMDISISHCKEYAIANVVILVKTEFGEELK